MLCGLPPENNSQRKENTIWWIVRNKRFRIAACLQLILRSNATQACPHMSSGAQPRLPDAPNRRAYSRRGWPQPVSVVALQVIPLPCHLCKLSTYVTSSAACCARSRAYSRSVCKQYAEHDCMCSCNSKISFLVEMKIGYPRYTQNITCSGTLRRPLSFDGFETSLVTMQRSSPISA